MADGDDPRDLRERAQRLRRLAEEVGDPKVQTVLREMALEFDERAAQAEVKAADQ